MTGPFLVYEQVVYRLCEPAQARCPGSRRRQLCMYIRVYTCLHVKCTYTPLNILGSLLISAFVVCVAPESSLSR